MKRLAVLPPNEREGVAVDAGVPPRPVNPLNPAEGVDVAGVEAGSPNPEKDEFFIILSYQLFTILKKL